jgi:hypothetical protein
VSIATRIGNRQPLRSGCIREHWPTANFIRQGNAARDCFTGTRAACSIR